MDNHRSKKHRSPKQLSALAAARKKYRSHSAETKAKISAAQKGKPRQPTVDQIGGVIQWKESDEFCTQTQTPTSPVNDPAQIEKWLADPYSAPWARYLPERLPK